MRSSPNLASRAVESPKSLKTTIATPSMRAIFSHSLKSLETRGHDQARAGSRSEENATHRSLDSGCGPCEEPHTFPGEIHRAALPNLRDPRGHLRGSALRLL